MTDPFLALAGAVEAAGSIDDDAEAAGLGVAAHFGSPLSEQRALEAGEAVVSLGHRGIVAVSGPDRLSWLSSITSQQLVGLAPGQSTESLLLDPNGRIEQAIRLVDDGERSWLLVDEGSVDALVAFLNRMRFALRVEIADVSDQYVAVLAFAGGTAESALRGLGRVVAEWRDPWAEVAFGGVQYAQIAPGDAHPGAQWSAISFILAREDLPLVTQLIESDTLRAAGLLALDALEIRAWRPTQHGEVDARAIPHEFDWMRTAVHLNKGCYRGQETVAKVHNLGHPPRRLVMLHLDGSGGELPLAGALVLKAEDTRAETEARPVGRVTRVALHHEWGGIALALLKRSVPEDAALAVRLGDPAAAEAASPQFVAATQEVIVPSDAGATRSIPRLKRL